jgi:signal transduction histidine kinase
MQELLVGVSHELGSPLTRMKVALEFIDNRGVRESLNEEIQTLDCLTGDLLENARRNAGGHGVCIRMDTMRAGNRFCLEVSDRD